MTIYQTQLLFYRMFLCCANKYFNDGFTDTSTRPEGSSGETENMLSTYLLTNINVCTDHALLTVAQLSVYVYVENGHAIVLDITESEKKKDDNDSSSAESGIRKGYSRT